MELVYEGPNVMLGYAESPADLALGDVQAGVLRTGDLGRVDDDGFFTLVGRLRRFAKLFGRRVSLEDVERELEAAFPAHVAATDGGDRIVIHAELDDAVSPEDIGSHVAKQLGVPPAAVVVTVVKTLPRTSSGKKDYRALEVHG
jgi:acyl-CoA synthetase (AMP-forming)/AMP-acid ligase II